MTAPAGVRTVLDTIVERKREEIARLPARTVTVEDLRAALKQRGSTRDFCGALLSPPVGPPALIAEVKKASPSAGVIRPDFDPVAVARTYEMGGAACLSVLTDEPFFQGHLEYLRRVRAAVRLPLLRKDFILDERQLLESVEWGADAVLLIVAILPQPRLQSLHDLAVRAGLSVLVEVHDETELERALALKPRLLGVNNRDLRTFQVDLGTTERLARRLQQLCPDPRRRPLLVAESGIHSRQDVERVRAAGADAILVGESLMRSADLPGRIRELMGLSG
ncbi:indole-3-glycerol phosphate synthase TrpC [Limisphaera ngatamarikiensis]|uniref:Indole-3-glycerol phosphate synthase n=1 Tax=Limisphaera ngatamarikiensis TaxID=1324935 RepID=A0A6M1S0R6_9BACT|nr:indole-3-glycerol phosphate synthase TrpC [Limisphaera ngatamarikiensis]NGO38970.1 indole-3-glycerol phosphate synthase TrpC [Limisphaera ngatamarikiensis]